MTGRRVSHYLLERLLGAGGMGEVHLARDLALGRPAALKILRPGVDPDRRARLLEEARIAARLQHPAIATFYESGESGDTAFIAMEYVPGETLRSRLRVGALPPAEAIGMAASILEGLVHAHALGILHRDIKPENVMLAGPGQGRLLDFGIAKQLARRDVRSDLAETALTEVGVLIGTPGYMAPEQWKGAAADERSDLFAVGAILHEALTGRPVFDGATPHERLAHLLTADVPRLEPAGAPTGTDALLARALARDPAARFSTASEFLAALQGLAAGGRPGGAGDTVAVIDFDNASSNPADAWIGSAVAEQLTGDLARVAGLQVLARERVVRAFASTDAAGSAPGGPAGDPLERAQRLGCRWLLSGSFQRIGSALRISSRLTEVPTARVVGSVRLDGTVDGIFAMQDQLASAVVREFPFDVGPVAPAAARASRVGAYELYATGRRYFQRLSKGTFADAKRCYEEAIEADPRYAPPHAGLAAIHALHFTFMTDPRELEMAEAYARRAIELDPTRGDAHAWLAYACWRTGRVDEALEAANQSAQLAAESSYGDYFAAVILCGVGRWSESVDRFRRAVKVDRGHAFAWMALGAALGELGQYDEAAWCVREAVALEGQFAATSPTTGAAGCLGEILRRQGRLDEARRACLDGIAATERSDHMYRDSMRAVGLIVLGSVALEQNDRDAADAAFTQAAAHLRGRPRTLGGRHYLARALAGLAEARGDAARLDEAVATLDGKVYDASWIWGGTWSDVSRSMRAAAVALRRADVAERFSGG